MKENNDNSTKSTKNGIPKDREIIIQTKLGKFIAIFSPPDDMFVYANHAVDMYQGLWNMHYYETEYIKEKDILEWKEF